MSYLTPLFCKLNDGREMVVFSDNEAQETMHVFPVADLEGYDAEFQSFELKSCAFPLLNALPLSGISAERDVRRRVEQEGRLGSMHNWPR